MKKIIIILLILSTATLLSAQIPLPYLEDFNAYTSYELPPGWTGDMDTNPYAGVDGSPCLAALLAFGVTSRNAFTPLIGPILENAKLTFDFRARDPIFPQFPFPLEYSTIQILIGGTEIFTITEDNYTPSINLAPYTVDLSAFAGQNINIEFKATTSERYEMLFDNVHVFVAPPFDLIALSLSGTSFPSVALPAAYGIDIYNAGSQIASGYTVKLMRVATGGDIELASTTGNDINPDNTHTTILNWTPQTTGVFQIYAYIDFEEDTNPADNTTQTMMVNVQPEGTEAVIIGNPNSTSRDVSIPFQTYEDYGLTQTIYHTSEITSAGSIIQVGYSFFGQGDIPAGFSVKLYLANVIKSHFITPNDWIPFSNFELVYDGIAPMNVSGRQDYLLTLDTPFLYVGDDLAVMAISAMPTGTGSISWENGHYITDVAQSRTLVGNGNDTPFDPSNYPTGWFTAIIPNTTLIFDTTSAGGIQGTITSDGLPLEGVEVSIVENGRIAFTDINGQYFLSNLSPGTYTMTAKKFMYHPITIENIVINEEPITINIEMEIILNSMQAISLNGPRILHQDTETTHTLTVLNAGATPQTSFDIILMRVDSDNEDIEITTIPINQNVPSGATVNIPFDWTPDFLGSHHIYAIVALEESEINEENISPTLSIEVVPAGAVLTYLGDPESNFYNHAVPYTFQYQASVTQSIYADSEINQGGVITHVVYNFRGVGTISPNSVYRLYFASVSQNTFPTENSWIPFNQFTLAFSGTLPLNMTGITDIIIPLQTPYMHGGGNLVVLAHRVFDPSTYGITNQWHVTRRMDAYRVLQVGSFNTDLNLNNLPNGLQMNFVPNMTLIFNTDDLGELSGIVSHDSVPLPDVRIEINNTPRFAISNASGFYEIPYLIPNDYTLTATKHGFYDFNADITIVPNELTTLDIPMIALPTVTVSGKVLAGDTKLPIAGCLVSLRGYDDYVGILTDNQGNFTINNVYAGFTYNLVISKEGYLRHEIPNLVVGNEDLVIPPIELIERAYPPYNVRATINSENQAHITWTPPGTGQNTIFSHATGNTIYDAIGTHFELDYTFQAFHRYTSQQLYNLGVAGAYLTQISFIPNEHNSIFTVRIYTGGYDNADFFPGTLVYQQRVTQPIVLHTWNDVTLDIPFEIPTDREMWIGYQVFVPAGMPAGIEAGPTIDRYGNLIHWFGNWFALTSEDIQGNFLIRGLAEGSTGPLVLSSRDLQSPHLIPPLPPQLILHEEGKKEHPFSTLHSPLAISPHLSPTPQDTRLFESYTIYRTLIEDITNEENWTLLGSGLSDNEFLDTDWGTLPTGAYRYVIKAVYTDENVSIPAFSNMLSVDMEAPVNINLTTDSGNPIVNALIRLSNTDGNPDHIYQQTVSTPTAHFPAIWLGTYNITISMSGYATISEQINIPNASLQEFDFILQTTESIFFESFEAVGIPSGWTIVDEDGDGEDWLVYHHNEAGFAHTGIGVAASESWRWIDDENDLTFTPDNYLITPPIYIPDYQKAHLRYYVASQNPTRPVETYSVLVSAISNPSPHDFIELFKESTNTHLWRERTVDLSDYTGLTIHIALRHFDSVGQHAIKIDDFEIFITGYTDDKDFPSIPLTNALQQNFPNPFNPETTISFDNSRAGNVLIEIFNIRGQRVKTLINEHYQAGTHHVIWSGDDDFGNQVGSGIYFYRMITDDFTQTKRMVLLK